ncbi:hypothetical protein ACFVRD_36815 [Streptomyces sp. NPDC057908]|uniref:hypothetical protein n=1 Tax=Streptomyces sp. NPDC057908 TaxID=3346276 RepID=UPI0036ECDDE9
MLTPDQNAPQSGESPETPEGELASAADGPLVPPARAPKGNRRQPGPQPVLDFPPVPNGIDYLRSVVKHLRPKTGGAPRDIKYAVLHLQAATEVLLKARLSRVHWSLIFKDPGKATAAKYADASFESCTTNAAVERLRNIAGIAISKKEADALDDLARDRNRLQHYGLTHNAQAVEARAATVLDFLVRFIDEHLEPELSESGPLYLEMGVVRHGLKDVQSFVTERMNRLRGNELKDAEGRTLRCPDCRQLAATVEGGWCICHFCGRGWLADELAYVLQTADHQDTPLAECPGCHAPTLTDDAEFADGKPTLYCTSCAMRYAPAELGNCAACGCYWPISDTEAGRQLICADCDRRIRQEEDERHWM